MAIQGTGLQFHPLNWVFHDQWRYYYPQSHSPPAVYEHWGHLHFFLLGYDFTAASADAYSGHQPFDFHLRDVWGPQSADPNQQRNFFVVGTPKWFFHVTELWRRMYVQPWELPGNTGKAKYQKRGLKYDASEPAKTAGPFREGRDAAAFKAYAPYWARYARALPPEHFHDDGLDQARRDNHVLARAGALLVPYAEAARVAALEAGQSPADAQAAYEAVFDPRTYDLQHSAYFNGFEQPQPARGPFCDRFYIWPLIEYQEVVQMDWERLPGGAATGDGWSVSVPIPFVHPLTKKTNSPFGEPQQCLPIGQYRGTDTKGQPLVPPERHPHYDTTGYDEQHPYQPPLNQPPSTSGHRMVEMDQTVVPEAERLPERLPTTAFHNPYGDKAGGRWVKQCLGGIVRAKALVTIEHRLGGQREVWVESTQYLPSTPFAGTDQMRPS